MTFHLYPADADMDNTQALIVGHPTMAAFQDAMVDLGMMGATSLAPDDGDWRAAHRDDNTDTLLIQHVDKYTVIPCHKVNTNDGWLITPGEINAALIALEEADLHKADEWTRYVVGDQRWKEFVKFLNAGYSRGGVRVR